MIAGVLRRLCPSLDGASFSDTFSSTSNKLGHPTMSQNHVGSFPLANRKTWLRPLESYGRRLRPLRTAPNIDGPRCRLLHFRLPWGPGGASDPLERVEE